MIELTIYDINDYYYLKDKQNTIYKFNLEFYDLLSSINKGDEIYINKLLFDDIKNTNELVSFGSLEGICGKKITNSNDKDILIIKNKQNYIYLKRYYG